MTKSTTKNKTKQQPTFLKSGGQAVAVTISKPEETLISRYYSVFDADDLRGFVRTAVQSTLRWMQRMINGDTLFNLQTMDHWSYDAATETLRLKNFGSKRLRDYEVVYDMNFTHGDIDEYHEGMGEILSSSWYKIHSTPTVIVEFVACCDLLYRKHHNNVSPASAIGVLHTDVDTLKAN